MDAARVPSAVAGADLGPASDLRPDGERRGHGRGGDDRDGDDRAAMAGRGGPRPRGARRRSTAPRACNGRRSSSSASAPASCPSASAQTPAAIDEERRLLYVALTRSEEELWCSWFERTADDAARGVARREPSPWLAPDRAGDRRAPEGGGADGRRGGLGPGGRAAAAASRGRGGRGRRTRPVRSDRPIDPRWGCGVACRNSWRSCARQSGRSNVVAGGSIDAGLHPRRGAHHRARCSAGRGPARIDRARSPRS